MIVSPGFTGSKRKNTVSALISHFRSSPVSRFFACGFETVFLTGYYWRGPGPVLRALRQVQPARAERLAQLLGRRRLNG